jgi:hypothetical protein
MEPGSMDIARLAMEKPDQAMQQRIAKLVERLAVKGHAKIDQACTEGSARKVGILRPLRLTPGKA